MLYISIFLHIFEIVAFKTRMNDHFNNCKIQYYMLLHKRFDIGTVICPRAVVLARGRTRGQITVPISNLLFNDNSIT